MKDENLVVANTAEKIIYLLNDTVLHPDGFYVGLFGNCIK